MIDITNDRTFNIMMVLALIMFIMTIIPIYLIGGLVMALGLTMLAVFCSIICMLISIYCIGKPLKLMMKEIKTDENNKGE